MGVATNKITNVVWNWECQWVWSRNGCQWVWSCNECCERCQKQTGGCGLGSEVLMGVVLWWVWSQMKLWVFGKGSVGVVCGECCGGCGLKIV